MSRRRDREPSQKIYTRGLAVLTATACLLLVGAVGALAFAFVQQMRAFDRVAALGPAATPRDLQSSFNGLITGLGASVILTLAGVTVLIYVFARYSWNSSQNPQSSGSPRASLQ